MIRFDLGRISVLHDICEPKVGPSSQATSRWILRHITKGLGVDLLQKFLKQLLGSFGFLAP